jgi:hypothetical protein
MSTSSVQSSGRRTVGLAVLIAVWMVVGLALHAGVEYIWHASFLADFLTLAYAVVTAFMFFAARRRRRLANS